MRAWASACAAADRGIHGIGYFGSYARGDWGVGSDLDVVIVVSNEPAPPPFEIRSIRWDVSALPVSTDLLVYTLSEWHGLLERRDRFARMLEQEVVWVHGRPAPPDG